VGEPRTPERNAWTDQRQPIELFWALLLIRSQRGRTSASPTILLARFPFRNLSYFDPKENLFSNEMCKDLRIGQSVVAQVAESKSSHFGTQCA
jgi:hypothetical protein